MKTILIVDDEYALVDTLKDLLEEAGYRVAVAFNGREALQAMSETAPALVVTDFMMPIMDGKELILRMIGDPRLSSVPVILMSAARRQITLPAGEQFPVFAAYLRKPFLLGALMDAVVAVIGRGE